MCPLALTFWVFLEFEATCLESNPLSFTCRFREYLIFNKIRSWDILVHKLAFSLWMTKRMKEIFSSSPATLKTETYERARATSPGSDSYEISTSIVELKNTGLTPNPWPGNSFLKWDSFPTRSDDASLKACTSWLMPLSILGRAYRVVEFSWLFQSWLSYFMP